MLFLMHIYTGDLVLRKAILVLGACSKGSAKSNAEKKVKEDF
jgi:hypothetical protein